MMDDGNFKMKVNSLLRDNSLAVRSNTELGEAAASHSTCKVYHDTRNSETQDTIVSKDNVAGSVLRVRAGGDLVPKNNLIPQLLIMTVVDNGHGLVNGTESPILTIKKQYWKESILSVPSG